ncbi:MAG: MFS transporter, partial [Culicoidibacterales bacterium]
MNNQQKLSNLEKYSYGFGALGKDLVCALVFTYLMFYFTDVLGISSAFVGGLFFFARFWDAINDPVMGMVVENTRTKWGKFRPWILIGTLINAVSFVFLFSTPEALQGTGLYIYVTVTYIVWGMTYTIMDIPYWSMLPSLTTNKNEREKIAVIPRIFASLAWLLIGTFG